MSDIATATSAIAQWAATEPRPTGAYEHDVGTYGTFWKGGEALMRRLPAKPRRSPDEAATAATILAAARQSRERFLAAHAERVYDRLTGNGSRFVRLEELVFADVIHLSALTLLKFDAADPEAPGGVCFR